MAKKSEYITKSKPLSSKEIQIKLIENFADMQKVLTNLTIKLDVLSDNFTRLLLLFETSAKTFIESPAPQNIEDRETLKKLDTLLEQNKTIARGLTLVEEKIRHKVYGEDKEKTDDLWQKPQPKPLPRI